ncbi:MAG: fibronectin type III domain-containing protein [Patescibacteria group bacterium]
MKNKNSFFRLLFLGIFASQFLFSGVFAATPSLSISALDTIAGYGTALKATNATPGARIVFTVQQPNSTQLFFDATADSRGNATAELSDYASRLAGIYYVSAEYKGTKKPGAPKPFRVYAESVSPSRSSLVSDLHIASLSATPKVNVTLSDAYGNPIVGHEVRLISTRADAIRPILRRPVTDTAGFVQFEVSSAMPGLSTLSAYDITAEVVLENRIQIFFTNSVTDSDPAIGGDDLLLAKSSSTSAVHTFEFEDVPDLISKNDPTTLTLTVYDSSKNVVSNYTGKIHFSVTSANANLATLPDDYTFTAKDLGKHTFSLAFQFQQKGDYKIRATDILNDKIYGEKTITVTGGKDGSLVPSVSVNILAPTPGKTGQNVQTVSGTAAPGKDVKIFDNNAEIGKASAGLDGKFSFVTPSLPDGNHEFYVVAVDEKSVILGTSGKVKITVDATPPELTSVSFQPNIDVAPEDPVQVTVVSEPSLSKISVSLGDTLLDLDPDTANPGNYTGTLAAPAQAGTYSVKVFMADELGNEISYDKQGSFTVVSSQKPSAVPNITAFPADARVNLVWGKATDDGTIAHYRIYYGTSAENLDQKVDTRDASTTWYIAGLQNATLYYFNVVAVDDQSQEGEFSPVVTSTPDASINPLFPAAPGSTGETGPEVLWLLVPSILAGRFLGKKKKII